MRAKTWVKDLADEEYVVLLKCARVIDYFAVVEGSEPFALRSSSIFVDPDLKVSSLQDELTRKYSSSHNCLSTRLYKVSPVHVYFYQF